MAEQGPIVTTALGQLAGELVSEKQGMVSVFRGIPYAQPPIGRLRWQPPQPMKPWMGVRDATKFGAMAMQRSAELEMFLNGIMEGQGFHWLKTKLIKQAINLAPKPPESEDCLTLNVRTPSVNGRLPVMVWIHGGAHQSGSSRDIFYDSNTLVHENVVVVSINYRLGLMGYFAHPELSAESEHNISGNYGTLDQIAALRWIKENIAAFGGDPDNITIFGESAGGESVLHMMCSPLARGLFHKAIAQSPATTAQLVYLKDDFHVHDAAETSGEEFMTLVGVDNIKQLRAMPAEILQAIVNQHHGAMGMYHPVIDGHVLPENMFTLFSQGKQAQLPLMIGSNGNESSLFYSMMQSPLPEYQNRIELNGRFPEYMQEEFGDDLEPLLERYPGLEDLDKDAVIAHQGDVIFGTAVRHYAGESANQGQPTYVYLFNRQPTHPNQTVGAFHAAELPFVHGSKTPIVPMDEQDMALSRLMISYWTQFAKTGNPNSSNNTPYWEPFADATPRWMVFDTDESEMQAISRETQYQIFMRRIQRKLATTPMTRLTPELSR